MKPRKSQHRYFTGLFRSTPRPGSPVSARFFHLVFFHNWPARVRVAVAKVLSAVANRAITSLPRPPSGFPEDSQVGERRTMANLRPMFPIDRKPCRTIRVFFAGVSRSSSRNFSIPPERRPLVYRLQLNNIT